MTKPSLSPLSRRNFLGILGGAGAAAALAACGGTSTPPGTGAPSASFGSGETYEGPAVTLAFWNGFTGGDGPFMNALVKKFMAENPNVTVKVNTLQWADYYPKVPNAVASGSGPDVGIMHIDQLATNAARRVIIPLDEIASGLNLTESDFAPAVWSAGVYQSARFGIPLDIHPLGFYANTAQLSKAGISALPADRAGFESAVSALQSKADVKHPFWITATWPAHLMFISLINQFGGSLYDEAGAKALFNSDAGIAAAEWLRGFVTSGASPADVSNDAQAQAFRQGRNSLTWDGIWMMNEWAKVDKLEWAAAALPTIGQQPAVWASSHNFVVTSQAAKDPNKLAASRAFISWISARSIDWAKSGQVPARNSVRESPEFAALKVQSALAQQLPHVVFPPAVPGIGDITTPTFERAIGEIVLGKAKPKEALDAATKKADAMLADNRAKYGS